MQKFALLLCLMCLLGIFLLLQGLLLLAPSQHTLTFEPIADTTIQWEDPGKNWGSDRILRSLYIESETSNSSFMPFIKFDLSGLPSKAIVSLAELRMYSENVSYWGGPFLKIKASFCSNNEWTEHGLTYYFASLFMDDINQTSINAIVVEEQDVWYYWNITDDVAQAQLTGELSEVLLIEGSYGYALFSSRETANPPELVIDYTLPAPWVVWMWIFSGSGLIIFGVLTPIIKLRGSRKPKIAKDEMETPTFGVPQDQTIKLAELANPMLDTAIQSLSNALEAFKKQGDRHRQAALLAMDQAVEYVLKAVLFQIDSAKFLKQDWQRMDYEKAVTRLKEQGIAIPEIDLLRKAHSARNEAQHRGEIATKSWTRFHLKNICKFFHCFCRENFDLDIDKIIPLELRLGFYQEPKRSDSPPTKNTKNSEHDIRTH